MKKVSTNNFKDYGENASLVYSAFFQRGSNFEVGRRERRNVQNRKNSYLFRSSPNFGVVIIRCKI